MRRCKSRKQTVLRKNKEDTPLKTSITRRMGLKETVQTKMCEMLPEDAEVNFTPIHRGPVVQVDHSDLASEDTPKLVIDTSASSDEDSSMFGSSSSPPSPEVFREEHYEEQCTFRLDDELTELHMPIKNSTLLERSHAENIIMYHTPNLSTIIDTPTVLLENSHVDTSPNKNPSDVVASGRTSDAAQETTAGVYKPVMFLKKRVCFRSPLFSHRSMPRSIVTPKLEIQSDAATRSPVAPSSPHKDIEPEKLEDDESDDVDGGTFFDFGCDSELEAYLNLMRERCSKLQNIAPFPSTAVQARESALISQKKNMIV